VHLSRPAHHERQGEVCLQSRSEGAAIFQNGGDGAFAEEINRRIRGAEQKRGGASALVSDHVMRL
jgi:hypothetical protein